MVPLPPVVNRKAVGCGCNPPSFLPCLFWSGTIRSLSWPVFRIGKARGVANRVEVRCVQWQRFGDVLKVKDNPLVFFPVQTFERLAWCALNRDDARFAFQVSRFQVFTWKYFFSCHGINLSLVMGLTFQVQLLPIVELRSPWQRAGLCKLDCAPMAEAVSASPQSPENVALCWRPWLAVRAIAGDGMCDLHHGRLPVPCSDTMRSSAAPSG